MLTNRPTDSTGREIRQGDRVRWRGAVYTIEGFYRLHTRSFFCITFVEPIGTDYGLPDEMSVDLVSTNLARTEGSDGMSQL